MVRDQPGDPLADPARDGDQPVPVRVQWRDRPEPSGQWSHHERREGDVDELQHEFHRDVPVDQDGFQGGRRRAVGSGGRVQRHQAADRVRLHGAGAQPVPVGRLRGGDAGSIDEEPDLEREPVRRRNAVVDVRDVQDLELHRHAIGRTRYGRVARGPVRSGGAGPLRVTVVAPPAPSSAGPRPPPSAGATLNAASLRRSERLATGRAVIEVLPPLHREVLSPAMRTVHQGHAATTS